MRGFCERILLVLLTCCVTCSYGKRISTKDIMDFFDTYDVNEPPRLDGPTEIRIGIYVNNLWFDNHKGVMHMNIYQRMAWHDVRLQKLFNDSDSDQKSVKFDDTMLKRTWRPDLFIRNADKSDRVDGIAHEHFFRVKHTGHVWYVVRLINDVYCPQLLHAHHTTVCRIMFESFSHTMDTLYLAWLGGPVDVDRDIRIPARTLKDVILYDCSQNYTSGAFPCLEIRWVLKRDTFEMTFDRGVYLVSAFLVIISWLGFWIPPSDKRIFLGLIIALILSVLYNVVAEWREFSCAECTRSAQIWLIFCLCMVLGMVLEFAVVYIVFGMLCTRIRGLCGGKQLLEEQEPQSSATNTLTTDDNDVAEHVTKAHLFKRSWCGDIIDTVFALVIFPALFIIMVFAAGFTTFAFR